MKFDVSLRVDPAMSGVTHNGAINRLSAVVVPMHKGEVSRMLDNFWLWDQDAFAPEGQGGEGGPRLILSFNNEGGRTEEGRLREAYDATTRVKRCFSGMDCLYLDLTGDRDVYIRDYSQTPPEEGFKAGPNNQFFETMARLAELDGYVFLMETDCVPIRAGWIAALQRIVEHAQPFWIMGSAYRGRAHLEASFARHINGNAVYAVGDAAFQRFLSEVWRPRLLKVVRAHDPRLAYDIFLEVMLTHGMQLYREGEWRLFQDIAHRLVYTDFIQNRSTELDDTFFQTTRVADFIARHPDTYLLHGAIFSRAVALLRESGREATLDNLCADLGPSASAKLATDPGPIGTAADTPTEATWSFTDAVSMAVQRAQNSEKSLATLQAIAEVQRRELHRMRAENQELSRRHVSADRTSDQHGVTASAESNWKDELIVDC